MKYTAQSVVSFGAGSDLGLSKPQADARIASLHPVDGRKGWYTTTAPVQFKAGEEFQYDGDLPKGVAVALEPVGAGRRNPEPKASKRAAEELAAKRADLRQQINALEESLQAAKVEDDLDAIRQQLDGMRSELAALG